MKKFGLIALLGFVTLGIVACGGNDDDKKVTLPKAWEEGETYQAKECSISLVPGSIENPDAKPVKDYLNVEGIRFYDLRDVKEGYGVGHIQGFESVSYFNTIVGEGHLFTKTETGFVANYKESEAIVNDLFPKDATLFVMCQVGGRVQPFLTLLAQLGYNMDNVYNIGGWNQIKDLKDYGGYEVSLGIGASAIEYDFSALTPVTAPAAVRKAAAPKMPVAWEEGETYQAKECSISLVPGSIENEGAKAVKDYFTTKNVRFFDLRDVKEGYGVGHIQKFETVSYFNTIVGEGHLFTKTDTGFVANYKESEAIINDIFPKDATLFVMCQVGGRVQPFLTLLAQLGYNMDNVYNVGGWNQIKDLKDYGGYEVALGIGASAITYDFSALTPVAA